MQEFVWTFLLRWGQLLLLGLPGVVGGVLVAGAIGTLVLISQRRRNFRGLVRFGAVLLLVPMTSLGALFVAERLRRTGADRRIVLLTLVSACTLPWSVAWGMSRVGVGIVLLPVTLSTLIAVISAWLAGRGSADDPAAGDSHATGSSLLDVLRAAGDSIRFTPILHMLIGTAGAALMALALPPGHLEETLGERTVGSFALAHAVATGAAINPEDAMVYAWQAIDLGALPGSALAWLTLGAGFHLGTLTYVGQRFGIRRAMVLLASMVICTVMCSTLLDRVTFDRVASDTDTHAFDVLGRPWHLGEDDGTGPAATTGKLLFRLIAPQGNWASPAVVSVVILVGLRLWALLRTQPVGPAPSASPRWLRFAPACVAGVWLVVGMYVYFPSYETLAPEVRGLFADAGSAVRQRDPDAERQLVRLELLLGRIPIGQRLRLEQPIDRAAIDDARRQIRQALQQLPTNPAAAEQTILATRQQLRQKLSHSP